MIHSEPSEPLTTKINKLKSDFPVRILTSGIMISLTKEVIIALNAAPIMNAIAKSMMLPLDIKSLNPEKNSLLFFAFCAPFLFNHIIF